MTEVYSCRLRMGITVRSPFEGCVHYLTAIWFLWNLSRIFKWYATLLNNSIDKSRGEWECNGLCKSVTEDIAVIALPPPAPSLPPSFPFFLPPQSPALPLHFSRSGYSPPLPAFLSVAFAFSFSLPFVSHSNTPGLPRRLYMRRDRLSAPLEPAHLNTFFISSEAFPLLVVLFFFFK